MQLDPDKLSDIFDMDEFKSSAMDKVDKDGDSDELLLNTSKVYDQLTELIKNGNDVFSTVKMMIEADPDAEMVHGAAQMLNAIRDTLREFTRIHIEEIRFSKRKELEEIKIEARKKELEYKYEKTKELLQIKNNTKQIQSATGETEDLYPFSQEQIVETIVKTQKDSENN